ncbi:MAG: glycosyltransferase family 2 protein [Desulfuromonadaceae bacterium]
MPKSSIAAVIVTHNPQVDVLSYNISKVISQVDSVIVIDNASTNQDVLHNLFVHKVVSFIANEMNLGIAAAFNKGANFAKSKGLSYILLLDQDSTTSLNMISRLWDAHNSIRSRGILISAVGPTYKDPVTENTAYFIQASQQQAKKQSVVTDKDDYVSADYLISSGSFISVEAFEEIGPFDESLFIDRVDTEWFFRARSLGFQAFGVPDAGMHHTLGEKTRKVWFGRWRHVPQHKPFRQYYMYRNSILLYKRDYIPLLWKINDLIKLVYLFAFSMFCMPEKVKRLSMITSGIFDGLRGKSGKLEYTLE